MKKLLALLLACIMLVTVFAACSEQQSDDESSSKKDKTSSVSSKQEGSSKDDTANVPPISEIESLPSSDLDNTGSGESSDNGGVEDPGYSEPGYGEDDPIEEDPGEELSPLEERMQNVLAGMDEEVNKESIYYEGSLVKLANVMRKADKGEKVKILFYGGANTSNNGAQTVDAPYARLIQEWWDMEFEAGSQLYIRGVSALTSLNACMRVEYDVTSYDPDIVVLDFAVEDAINNMAKTNAVGYDNLIRRIIGECPDAAIIGLMLPGAEQLSYNMTIKNCSSFITAANYHKEICKYYDIPVIDADTAIWDIMFDLIEVTTKTEMPLMTWENISQSNVALNSDGHFMLAGMFGYFFDQVHGKLKTIGTKAPATPTVGYQGSNKYMKGYMIPMNEMVEGFEDGYYCDLYKYDETREENIVLLGEQGYGYSKDKSDINGLTPNVRAYQHFIAPEGASDADKALEKSPYYVSFIIPEVKDNQTAKFMIHSHYNASKNLPNSVSNYGPVTIECYNADGRKLNSPTKVAGGNYAQAVEMYKTQAFDIPTGTVKMTFKVYANGGPHLLGMGYFEQ